MSLNWKFVFVGLFVCTAGAWLIFRPDPASIRSATAEGAAATSDNAESAEPTERRDGESSATNAAEESESTTGTTTSTTQPQGSELNGLTLQTVPTPTSVEIDSNCDPAYAGLGVEYRAWGDVLLPYTPGYPTSDPGEVWDCTADTVFGGAIAMVHAAYLEALRPDVIPAIALDTPGRDARINRHAGTNTSASLGFLCAPIGWNWDGEGTWSLLHQCGEGEPRVTYFVMEHRNGRWWLVYPRSGEIETTDPPEGYEYYAFIGGD